MRRLLTTLRRAAIAVYVDLLDFAGLYSWYLRRQIRKLQKIRDRHTTTTRP